MQIKINSITVIKNTHLCDEVILHAEFPVSGAIDKYYKLDLKFHVGSMLGEEWVRLNFTGIKTIIISLPE